MLLVVYLSPGSVMIVYGQVRMTEVGVAIMIIDRQLTCNNICAHVM